jgi:sulfite reductase subunit B
MNIYKPSIGKIKKIKKITYDTKSFTILMQKNFSHQPGQFVEVWAFGAGEAPISISSKPSNANTFTITVRKVGEVTSRLHEMKKGDLIGIRGPFGKAWPIEKAKGKDLTIIVGGIGIAPLRGVIKMALQDQKMCNHLTLLYGARSPRDIVFREELEEWKEASNITVHVTVDEGNGRWKGNVGLITTLFDKIDLDPENNMVLMCGPPIMMFFVTKNLREMGFKEEDIYVSLERHMRCGVGKCGHCNIGKYYVCKDGPVFAYSMVKKIPEVFK